MFGTSAPAPDGEQEESKKVDKEEESEKVDKEEENKKDEPVLSSAVLSSSQSEGEVEGGQKKKRATVVDESAPVVMS